ncbi:hypothetical protein ASE90_09520 [Sphingomonas sp. Leaf67]|nr:hypothetical protein ASE90_09520 [Sphingomonas sp. Leaf67]
MHASGQFWSLRCRRCEPDLVTGQRLNRQQGAGGRKFLQYRLIFSCQHPPMTMPFAPPQDVHFRSKITMSAMDLGNVIVRPHICWRDGSGAFEPAKCRCLIMKTQIHLAEFQWRSNIGRRSGLRFMQQGKRGFCIPLRKQRFGVEIARDNIPI